MHIKSLLKKAEEIKDELINIRRDIHAHPEPGLKEVRTSKLVTEKLRALGLEVQAEVGVTGVIGTLKGKYPGKTILLRADMDCLEMNEQNDFEFKSQNPGYMHACGHDAHVSWLLGAAAILSQLKDEIKGNVKFLFQPAEEVLGGAERMIKQGALLNPQVDAVIGGHVWPSMQSGKIGIKYGPMMAAPDIFNIKIFGKGGHGAMPHICIDPVSIACQVYMGLQTLISRRINAVEPAVITVGKFTAGSAHNIIPDMAELTGTTRTFNDKLRDELPVMMESLIKGITEANGGTYEFVYTKCYPAVVNDAYMADFVKSSVSELLGDASIELMNEPVMVGEDFSFFQREVPGVLIAVGTRNEEKGITHPLHSAQFNVDEDIIHRASAIFAACAVRFLNGQ